MTITREEVTELYAPFPLDAHSIREGHKVSGGKKIEWFVYLDRMAIQRRLDELFPGEWESIYLAHATDGDISTVYLSIAIRGLRRDFNGTGKPHRARDSEEEGVDENSPKGAMTDAFRRAASLWGLGAYLWELPHIYTESYPGGDWKAKKACENDAQQQFTDWYKRQFGAVATAGQMRNMDAPPADEPPPQPAQPKGTKRQNPYANVDTSKPKYNPEMLRVVLEQAGYTQDRQAYFLENIEPGKVLTKFSDSTLSEADLHKRILEVGKALSTAF